MRRLFVLSGGGPSGIDIHTGILKALKEFDILPDFWSGTSAGSIISAWCTSHGFNPDALEAFVRSLDDSLLTYRNLWYIREAWLDSMMSNVAIYNKLKASLPKIIPSNLNTWAMKCQDLTRVNTADNKISPDLPTAVLASMSIHGIWPTVKLLDGNSYTDAGFRFNLPYDESFYPDYDEVWLLIASGAPHAYDPNESGLIGIAQQDIDWLVENTVLTVLERYANDSKVKVIWPLLAKPNLSFDHTLIDKGYEETKKQIQTILQQSPCKINSYKNVLINEVRCCRKTVV